MSLIGIRLFKVIFILLASLFANAANADVLTKNLASEIRTGNVSITGVEGTGGSSGTVLDGYLINNTKKEMNLEVFLKESIHLINQGRGQNMYVLGVLDRSGRFIRSGSKSFIKLAPKKKVAVKFYSYCADFDKDNPSPGEEFLVGVPPQNMAPLLARISSYQNKHPVRDITKAAQVAIWIAQGESPSAILDKFEYSQTDLELAYRFIGN
jgi:hypothetical protein